MAAHLYTVTECPPCTVPILFADLECLLLRNKTLRSLVLDGGIDSGDGLDEISPEDHCLPLDELHVMSPLKIAGRIGKEQLCWLVSSCGP